MPDRILLLTCHPGGRFVTVAAMPQVTLRYTLWSQSDSRTFEREAELDPLPAVGDSIDAYPPAVEPYDVASVELDPTTGRTIVNLRHWDPDEPMDRPLNWESTITQADVQDLIDGGWREIGTRA